MQTDQKPWVPVFRSLSNHWSVAFAGSRSLVLKASVSISIIQATSSCKAMRPVLNCFATDMSFTSFEYSLDRTSLPYSSSSFRSAFSAGPPVPFNTLLMLWAALCIEALYRVPLKWRPKSSPCFWVVTPSFWARRLNVEKLSDMLECPKDLIASLWLWRAKANSFGPWHNRICTVTDRPHSHKRSKASLSSS